MKIGQTVSAFPMSDVSIAEESQLFAAHLSILLLSFYLAMVTINLWTGGPWECFSMKC